MYMTVKFGPCLDCFRWSIVCILVSVKGSKKTYTSNIHTFCTFHVLVILNSKHSSWLNESCAVKLLREYPRCLWQTCCLACLSTMMQVIMQFKMSCLALMILKSCKITQERPLQKVKKVPAQCTLQCKSAFGQKKHNFDNLLDRICLNRKKK